jgi:trehalose/maltose transport system substrate-binding protein
MKKFALGLSALGIAIWTAGPIRAAEISFAANTTGKNVEFLNKQLAFSRKIPAIRSSS